MISEAKWETGRDQAAVVRGRARTRAARLTVVGAASLIFAVLPLHSAEGERAL